MSVFLKRAFDVISAAAGLVFLGPLLLWIAWRIRREDVWRVGTLVTFDSYWLPCGMDRKTGKGDPEKELQGVKPQCCHAWCKDWVERSGWRLRIC